MRSGREQQGHRGDTPGAHNGAKLRLFNRGFNALIVTQFFGAANDNLLKTVLTFMVINGIWADAFGKGSQGLIFLIFNLPFILLSGYAGRFADRYSKRTVSVLVKIAEVPIALVAGIGFWTGNLWLTVLALVLLCSQSAFFGPAKYGVIVELVGPRQLSRANGVINMMTNLAVIVGSYFGGPISDLYYPTLAEPAAAAAVAGQPQAATQPFGAGQPATTAPVAGRHEDPTRSLPWLPGAVVLGVALAGLAAVVFMPRLAPGDPTLKFDWNPVKSYVDSLRRMRGQPLLWVLLAWAFFYFVAALILLLIPEYAPVLGVGYEVASRILAVLGLTIGVGSAVAGWVSGDRIEPRLVPLGAAGVAVFLALLGVVPPTFWNVCLFVGGAGFFAGFYIIPLQALLQQLSPDDERARFLGTANAVSFTFLSAASGLYWLIRPWFGDAPQGIALLSAVVLVVGASLMLLRVRHMLFGRTSA